MEEAAGRLDERRDELLRKLLDTVPKLEVRRLEEMREFCEELAMFEGCEELDMFEGCEEESVFAEELLDVERLDSAGVLDCCGESDTKADDLD